MKKILMLIFTMVAVLGFAASAFAIHEETSPVVAMGGAQVTVGGEISIWNWYRDNISDFYDRESHDFLPRSVQDEAFSMERIRLSVGVKTSDNVSGLVELESIQGLEGEGIATNVGVGNTDYYKWQALNNKKSGVMFRQAWILYTGSGLLGVPAGIKIGHMPLALGLGKMFNNTRWGDDAIVLFADPTKQLHVGVLTFKVAENSNTSDYANADVDVYTALANYTIDDKSMVGAYYIYIDDRDVNAGLYHFQNLGIHGTTKAIENLTLRGEVDFQFGKLNRSDFLGPYADETKQEAYLIYLDAAYKLDPVTIRAAFGYGTGDADATDNKNKQLVTFLGPDQNVAWIYEYQVATPANGLSGGFNHLNTGLTNTTMYNVGVDYSPMKDLMLSGDGYLLYANKVPSGVSKKLGWEADLKSVYQVSKGLTWTIQAGYFSPGSYYQDVLDAATYYTQSSPPDKKAAVAARSELKLAF